MPFAGIVWGTIICLPFWLIVISLFNTGILASETIIFVGLILSGLLLFLILTSPQPAKKDEQGRQRFRRPINNRPLNNMAMELKLADNGGTRTGIDRRRFHYTAYIPEKRSGIDRRRGFDRRRLVTQRIGVERRSIPNTL